MVLCKRKNDIDLLTGLFKQPYAQSSLHERKDVGIAWSVRLNVVRIYEGEEIHLNVGI